MRILSGIQPSGSLHIANYFAMMKRMIESQEKHDLFCFIVNYHALTSVTNPQILKENTTNAILDFLALGLNPDLSTFYVQSDIPEVCELMWILSNHTSMGLLERAHSYKDKIAKKTKPHDGLFQYPVLMTSDILLYQADLVPVGKDQKQHLEIAKNISIKFNKSYGKTFKIPETWIDKNYAIIPGTNGKKMSKSYDNTIEIFSTEKSLRKKIMSIVTDSTPINSPKNHDNCNLYSIISLFMTENERKDLIQKYKAGISYKNVKEELFERTWEYFQTYRKKRKILSNNLDEIYKIMQTGAQKAQAVAHKTLKEVRKKIGLKYQ